MKRLCLFMAALFFLSGMLNAQIQYTKKNIVTPEADVMQLVANVGGAHHLLYFSTKHHPVIYVFNSLLQSCSKQEIDIKPRQSHDVDILQFKKYYLLYFHSPGSTRHQLFLVKADGSSKDISTCLSRITDSSWNRS